MKSEERVEMPSFEEIISVVVTKENLEAMYKFGVDDGRIVREKDKEIWRTMIMRDVIYWVLLNH